MKLEKSDPPFWAGKTVKCNSCDANVILEDTDKPMHKMLAGGSYNYVTRKGDDTYVFIFKCIRCGVSDVKVYKNYEK